MCLRPCPQRHSGAAERAEGSQTKDEEGGRGRHGTRSRLRLYFTLFRNTGAIRFSTGA